MLAATVTPVIGTPVTIVTVRRRSRHTFAGLEIAGLLAGTHIIITAVTVLITLTADNRGKHTPGQGITGVHRAAVSVVAADGYSRTVSACTAVICRTFIFIIASGGVIGILAASHRLAPVICTYFTVFTFRRFPLYTFSGLEISGLLAGTYIIITAVTVLITLTATDGGKHTTG